MLNKILNDYFRKVPVDTLVDISTPTRTLYSKILNIYQTVRSIFSSFLLFKDNKEKLDLNKVFQVENPKALPTPLLRPLLKNEISFQDLSFKLNKARDLRIKETLEEPSFVFSNSIQDSSCVDWRNAEDSSYIDWRNAEDSSYIDWRNAEKTLHM